MWFNPIMEWLLKSPFHGLISGNTMIIFYRGCKSGKAYHTPVSYQRINQTLLTTSWKDRTWWRNLREGCDVKVLLKGSLVEAHARVTEDAASVEGLTQFIGTNPGAARMLKVAMSKDGKLDIESLKNAASMRVIIVTTLK
jgi:hypothetical protein